MNSFSLKVCFPDRFQEIDKGLIDKSDILEYFKKNDWRSQVKVAKSLKKIIHYPSAKFISNSDNNSLELIADIFEYDEVRFLLLFSKKHPKSLIRKIFNLAAVFKNYEKEFSELEAYSALALFIDGEYELLVQTFQK